MGRWEEWIRCTILMRWRWVVEVNVEEQLVFGVGEALTKLAQDGAVAGTDVVLEDFTEDDANVLHFG